jgi:predicted phage terminase large subunit-like protein
VGGPITGRGANIGIIDDPFKNFEEAQSDTVRESVYQWYKSTFRTRLAPNGAIVLIMTRWHEDDLAGRLLLDAEEGGEQWDVIEFPAIATMESDQLGRTAGEALSPRFPISEIEKLKSALGPYLFNALYQQRPRPEEGNFFNVNWLIDCGSLRALLNQWKQQGRYFSTYAAMDLAITEKEQNAFNAISVGLVTPDNEKILCDVVRFKGDTYDIAQKIIEVQKKWKPLLFVFEEGQIRKAIWPVVIKMSEKAEVPINYDFVVPITDKLARARTLQGQMRNGEWLFPHKAAWFEAYQEEGLGFPNTKFKDQVDSHAHLARSMADLNIMFDPTDLNKCAA